MSGREITAVLFATVATAGTVAAALGYTLLAKGPNEIELVARAPERGNWSPQTIEVVRGHEVKLTIRNADNVTHGFYLPALGLNAGVIKASEVVELTFTPDTTGEFTFYCSVWCSDHHMHMRGTLVVK